MIVQCMSKEIQDEDKIKVYLVTPYEREMGTKGNVTIAGTYEETKHIIVGREYEVILNEVVEVVEEVNPLTILIKDQKIPLDYECNLRFSVSFDGRVAVFSHVVDKVAPIFRIDIIRGDLATMKTIQDNFTVIDLPF